MTSRRIKLLCAVRKQIINPFVNELNEALSREDVEIVWDLDEFWKNKNQSHFDIVHVHWPEFLLPSGEIIELEKLESTMAYWYENSKVVITRHNADPHNQSEDIKLVYKIVYNYTHGVVHLGKHSLLNSNFNLIQNTVIPHHTYSYDLQSVKKELPELMNKEYVLIFGQIRDERERLLVKKVANYLKTQHLATIVPQWTRSPWHRRSRPFKWLRFFLKFLIESIHLPFVAGWREIPQEKMSKLFNSCRFVILPRINTLNSGIISQAFVYGKVVVGTKNGNIGEMLSRTGNPVFDPEEDDDIKRAINEGLELSKKGQGAVNYRFALDYLHSGKIAKSYKDFFTLVLSKIADKG